jgi:hypothetical protein
MRDRWRLIAIVFLLTSGPWALAGDEAELSGYFEGLRAQGLFRVAEEYALDRLADPEIPATTRAILAVELSKVFATHAAEARSEGEALELWTRAGEVIAPLLAQRDNPRWFTVRSRQATIQCELALTEFWMSQLDPDSVARRDAALQSAFTALTELQTAASDLKGGTPPGLRGTKAAEGTLTTAELRHLGDEIEYLTIRMQLNRARLSPTGADRAAALLNAEQGSTALARRVNSDFVWPARLARIEAMRLQGDPEKAFTFAKSLLTPDLSPTLTDALVAEQARAKLALNTPADAIALVLEQGRMSGTLAPELRAIAIECLLVSLQAAQDKGDAALVDDLFQQATTQQQLITGPWRVYIDSLLARTHETRQYGEKLAALVREGRVAAQRRDWPAAAEAYARASQVAATDGSLDRDRGGKLRAGGPTARSVPDSLPRRYPSGGGASPCGVDARPARSAVSFRGPSCGVPGPASGAPVEVPGVPDSYGGPVVSGHRCDSTPGMARGHRRPGGHSARSRAGSGGGDPVAVLLRAGTRDVVRESRATTLGAAGRVVFLSADRSLAEAPRRVDAVPIRERAALGSRAAPTARPSLR